MGQPIKFYHKSSKDLSNIKFGSKVEKSILYHLVAYLRGSVEKHGRGRPLSKAKA